MKSVRPPCLEFSLVCFIAFAGILAAQPAPPPAPSNPQAQPKKQPNPFETVPEAADPAKPEQKKDQKKTTPFETVPESKEQPTPKKAAPESPTPEAPQAIEDVVETIEFRGSRRVPQDTLRAIIFTRKGDKLDEESLHRDFLALWNTGRFDDLTLEKEPGKTGWIIRFVVVERRMIRSIKYEGAKSVTQSEILDRFKERKVGLSVESQYDPGKVQRAAVVLKEYLAERGRQYATVEPEVRQFPPSSLEVVFRVTEGPKVKVGDINIENNKVFSDREVIRAMKNLHPIGIPRSILFESLFAKTFDSSKLEEDKERVRQAYMEKGYFTTRVSDHEVKVRDVGGTGFRIPIFYPNKPGKRADLKLTVEESRLYKLNKINFSGIKFFRTPEALMGPLFQMQESDVFSTAKLRKGLENMRKLYGEFGYIDMVPEPDIQPIPNSDKIDLTLNVDEGKQFFVRRIDFSGNTTTRDKVIRRELLIDEGDMFNTRFWELSILRLNQLGYFEALKENEAADIKRDTRTNTVDITLRVKERGKNSVQFSGGVSGIAGTFVSMGYSTNNFLGLGETLGISTQLGDRLKDITFSFTEPYLFDRPFQGGFTLFVQRFNFDQGREISLATGRNLLPYFQAVGTQNLLNYVSQGYGGTTFVSYPLRRSFARVGITYSYSVSNITTLSAASQQYFTYLNFQSLSGPNSLQGIRTSSVIPNYSYNSVDHPITPTRGRSLYISTTFAGSFLGGNVNMVEPSISSTYFRSGFKKGHVIGMRGLGRFVTGFSGLSAPPFNRFYMGGENDIRGFEIWGISPVAFIPSETSINVLNEDGSARMQKVIQNGVETLAPVTQQIPVYQTIFPGGDTQLLGNFEYRIPIVGPVTLAAFFDGGVNKVFLPGQLRVNDTRINELNTAFPQAAFDGKAVIAKGTEKIRTSTGLELQIMMPVVNAPFRFYWAYNPTIVQEFLSRPIVTDRSYFPNQATFARAVALYGTPSPFYEKRSTFRFTISRTF